MTDTKISNLTASTAVPVATDVFPTVENMGGVPATKRKAWSVYEAYLTTVYAGTATVVTGGNAHDHVGGDGALIPAAGGTFTATDKLLGRSTAGAGAGEEIACTAAGRALLDDADAAAQLTTLGAATASLTFTSKRITSRVGTVTSAATITPTGDDSDLYIITAQAAAATVVAPTGTPTDGQKLILRFLDNGTARALTWNVIYKPIGVTLPTTTVVSKKLYVGFVYNVAGTAWDCVAVQQEA